MSPETASAYLQERVAAARLADIAAKDDLADAIAAFPHGEREAHRLLASARTRAAAALDLRQAIRAAHPQPCEPALPCDFHVSYPPR